MSSGTIARVPGALPAKKNSLRAQCRKLFCQRHVNQLIQGHTLRFGCLASFFHQRRLPGARSAGEVTLVLNSTNLLTPVKGDFRRRDRHAKDNYLAAWSKVALEMVTPTEHGKICPFHSRFQRPCSSFGPGRGRQRKDRRTGWSQPISHKYHIHRSTAHAPPRPCPRIFGTCESTRLASRGQSRTTQSPNSSISTAPR